MQNIQWKTFLLQFYSAHENKLLDNVSFIRNHTFQCSFSEIWEYELLHMFAIVYAVNHAGWGDDTGHPALCQEPAAARF